jgi:acyl-CoA reductase-like NAD-dependent aldehyde dehydrogenase
MSVAEPVALAESVKKRLKPDRLFIDGREEDAVGGKTIDVMNPATGERLATVADGDAPDIDRAVAAARRSFEMKSWRGMDPSPKEKILWDLSLWQVLAAIRFRSADEAVEIANSTIYGLVSAVWTRDIQLAYRAAGDIKAGAVWINTYNGFDTATPFGGYKQSGYGRDLGAHALEEYTNVKSVWAAL